MRVDNQFLSGFNVRPSEVRSRATKAGAGKKNASAPSASHASSSELTQIVSLVAQEPEIRLEVVHRAEERIAAGEYDTLERAQETARAMLASGE